MSVITIKKMGPGPEAGPHKVYLISEETQPSSAKYLMV